MLRNVVKPGFIEFDGFAIDLDGRVLLRDGVPVALGPKAFDLLVYLVARAGVVVKKDEILDAVWDGAFVEEANIAVQIAAIRKALGESSREPRYVLTIPGQGYKFASRIRAGGERVDEAGSLNALSEQSARSAQQLPARTGIFPFGSKNEIHNKTGVFLILLALAAGIAGFLLWKWLYFRPDADTKAGYQLSRLTFSGKVKMATISPDSHLIAYVAGGEEGEWLTVRQTQTGSELKLTEPLEADFWGLEFSRDGQFIYYTVFFPDRADPETYRIGALGGISERIPKIAAPSVSYSPVEDKIAFLRSDVASGRRFLAVSQPDGSDMEVIGTLAFPETFLYAGGSIDWSPSGKAIAAITFRASEGEISQCITIFRSDDGEVINPCVRTFSGLYQIAWPKDNEIVLIANDENGREGRLRSISLSGDSIRDLDSGISEIVTFGVDRTGTKLTAVQKNNYSSIRIIGANDKPDDGREIIAENGKISLVAWVGEDQIVFRSERSGSPELWTTGDNGTLNRQLTVAGNVAERGLCFAPERGIIVFVTEKAARSMISAVNPVSGKVEVLTDGHADAYPVCSVTGGAVFYQSGIYTRQQIRQLFPSPGDSALSVGDEGAAGPTTKAENIPNAVGAKWPAISADGRMLAFLSLTPENWILTVRDRRSGTEKSFPAPANLRGYKLQFSPDGRSLFYLGILDGETNVWKISLGDGQIAPVTSIRGANITDFSVSNLGGRLAVAIDSGTTDVVLLTANGRS